MNQIGTTALAKICRAILKQFAKLGETGVLEQEFVKK
jgi:hypothetical protein